MKILFASSEAHPLIKTGGLADVSGSLPRALKRLGNDARLIIPYYRGVQKQLPKARCVAQLTLPASPAPVRILKSRLPGTTVTLYLVDSPVHFDRAGGPYSAPQGGDWPDNAHRFALFSQACVAIAMDRANLNWKPDLVQCNDWQTGLIPALLQLESERPKTVFTIHNLAYQGLFPAATFHDLRLPAHWWHYHALEFHGNLSFIKGGLVFADHITTVSPTYAREILTTEFGCGLEGLLQHRQEALSGILNGIDFKEWNPGTDPHLAEHYSIRTLNRKQRNKRALQREFKLPERKVPLLGLVGRLVEQKGIDLLLEILPQLLQRDVQLAILGSGHPHLQQALEQAHEAHPRQLGLRIGYDEGLAHRVEAGADLFLMPSRFEPCGLNQLYSMRYGTVPVVRRTGGLADSVVNVSPESLKNASATGFQFDAASSSALLAALNRALALYEDKPAWKQLVIQGMRQDFSWDRSAREYQELFQGITDQAP